MARSGRPQGLHPARGLQYAGGHNPPSLTSRARRGGVRVRSCTKTAQGVVRFRREIFSPYPASRAGAGGYASSGALYATFVAAFLATLEYGMEGAGAVCKNRVLQNRVRTLREELEQPQKTVEVYLRRHYTPLLHHEPQRQGARGSSHGNERRSEGEYDRPRKAGRRPAPEVPIRVPPVRHRHPHAYAGATRLRELVEEGARSSLTERHIFWT